MFIYTFLIIIAEFANSGLMEEKFPHGPWKEIFFGEWSGYETRLYENPDKLSIITVLDRDKNRETKGVVIFANKYFVAEGDQSKFAETLGGYCLVFEKFYPNFRAKYLMISSGPKYVEAETISSGVEEALSLVEAKSEEVRDKSKTYDVELTDLKNASDEYSSRLFSEPLLLQGMVFRQVSEKVADVSVLIGKKLDGSPAEENLGSFFSTVVIGENEQRKTCLKVLMEALVLAGVTCIVFDEEEAFLGMSTPSKNFAYAEFPNLQPIGMPVKNLEPGKIPIDINLLEEEVFKELLRVGDGENYLGKESAEIIVEALGRNSGRLEGLSDLEERVMEVKEEELKFHAFRAVRWLKVLDKVFPGYIDGRINVDDLVTKYVKTSGSIVRINLKDVPLHIRKAFIYSTMKFLLSEGSRLAERVNIVGFIPMAEKYVVREPIKKIDKKILEVLTDCQKVGVGFCLSAGHDIDLYPEIVYSASLKIDFVSGNEIAVKERTKRPYRAHLRPRLSA